MTMVYKKILVAVDGSKEAEKAFMKSIEIAKRNNNSTLILTHILDVSSHVTLETYDKTLTERVQSYSTNLLEEYKEKALANGIEHLETVLEYGSPKYKIAKDVATEYEVDLIVCGATGLNAVERFILGSVSEHIVRYAKCDVLVVK